MATLGVKIKIMPESLDTDLNAIKEQGKEKIAKEGGVANNFDEEEIAFGLKALIVTLAWPEGKDTELIEHAFTSIPGVSSVSVLDVRRVIG